MEASPLTQDIRPEIFQPKIVRLYETLFRSSDADDDELEDSEGFWQEFFLLKPDAAALKRVLRGIGPDEMLHMQVRTQTLFTKAIARVKAATGPGDEIALDVRKRS
jgi:hypothetical protein